MPMPTTEAQREYQRKWMAERRRRWLEGRSCVDCGSTVNLEVDHVDRSVKVTHNVWSWREDRREAELAKCVTRCHDCHLDRTRRQLTLPVRHGHRTTYRNGCRCDECKAGQREHMRQWRAKRRAAAA